MAGFAGLGVIAPKPTAAEEIDLETDPHTRDTFRAVVDAMIPETSDVAIDRGEEHEPGALAVDLEEYLIWSFNNFHEFRTGGSDLVGGLLVDDLTGTVDLVGLDLDLSPLETLAVEETGEGFEVVKELESEVYTLERPNYPYAEIVAVALDVVAAELLARDNNEESPEPSDEFAAGGLYAQLAPNDRLRALESIVDGSAIDTVHDAIGDVFPHLGILKFVVFGVNGFVQFGYYSEWSCYGETKNDPPNQRVFEGGVQSHEQTGYPGPAAGYAELREFPGDGVFELGEDGFQENDY